VQTTDLDESGRLLSVGSTDIFEMFAESERVIENGHTTSLPLGGMYGQCLQSSTDGTVSPTSVCGHLGCR
jgi:hypothetical protein